VVYHWNESFSPNALFEVQFFDQQQQGLKFMRELRTEDELIGQSDKSDVCCHSNDLDQCCGL
jgi:hypothetical protein